VPVIRPQPKPVKVARPRKPLARKTWMKKRKPRRLSRAGSDPGYLAFVRTLRCYVATDVCRGRVHAHHAVHLSQGGVDLDAIPLCQRHHSDWHEARGMFGGLSKLQRFAFSMRAIADTQAAVAASRTEAA
jgi:hypothetical protein